MVEKEDEEEKRTDLKRRKRAGEAAELTHYYSYWQQQRTRSPPAVRHALRNDNRFDDGPPNNNNNTARPPPQPYHDQAAISPFYSERRDFGDKLNTRLWRLRPSPPTRRARAPASPSPLSSPLPYDAQRPPPPPPTMPLLGRSEFCPLLLLLLSNRSLTSHSSARGREDMICLERSSSTGSRTRTSLPSAVSAAISRVVECRSNNTLVPPQLLFPVVLTSPLGPAATGHLQSCFPDRGWIHHTPF